VGVTDVLPMGSWHDSMFAPTFPFLAFKDSICGMFMDRTHAMKSIHWHGQRCGEQFDLPHSLWLLQF